MTLTRLGKYDIVAKIGQGGMGEVYRAHDAILGRDVAIKTMLSEPGAEQEELRKRFQREAQSAARLNHPNIVTVHEFGEDQGRLYIVMELLEGSDLKEIILGPRLSVEAQLTLMEQVCDGLAFAHAKDVIHRDLKPANIHVSPMRQVKIMDFGLARVSSSNVTRAGMILGTPNYMAPEQVKAEKVTTRSDVFSLGAVFYELLSGRKSFDAESLAGVLYQVMQSQPEPLETFRPEAPRALCDVVRRAMEKDPAHRYADASVLREALREARRSMGPVTLAGLGGATEGFDSAAALTAPPKTLTRPPAHTPSPRSGGATARAAGSGSPDPGALEETRVAPAGEPTLAEPTTVRPSGPPQLPTVAVRDLHPAGSTTTPRRETSLARRRVDRPASGGRLLVIAAVVAGVLGVAVLGWRLGLDRGRPGVSPEPVSPSPAEPPVTTVPPPPSADAAERAFDSKDYRRAVTLAEKALQGNGANTTAQGILDRARRAVGAGDQAAARARRALDQRDSEAASRELTGLIDLDPGHPDIPTLTASLNGLLKAQASELRRARAATPVPVRPPVTTPPTLPPATTPPGPKPTVATPPPTTAPPATQPPPPSPEVAIRKTLDQYQEACRRLDPVAIRHLFPLIKDDTLKVFAKMESYDVTFDDVKIRLEGDRFATVDCLATYEATPRSSGRVASRSQKRQTIRLEKVDSAWVIRSVD